MPVANEKQKKNSKLRHLEYYGMQGTLDKLYADSQAGKIFTGLMPLIISADNIRLAYRNIKRNRGSFTCGVDRLTIRDIEKMPEEEVVHTIQTKLQWYIPKAVKRVEIPKPDGRLRPLGIPSMWDRLIQQCILQVLEPICEARFYERSNGFRPNRSVENAIAQCYFMIQKNHLHFVVDIDIKGFFDNVNHVKLIRQIWTMGIRDKRLICIIKAMLKAPVMLPNGTMEFPGKGTPQGGILSPLLSNIVLNELDWWIASQWEHMPAHDVTPRFREGGGRNRGHEFRAFRTGKLKEMQIVRYADDFKIFCRTRSDAIIIFNAAKQWLGERLKLEINEEKSCICNLRKKYSEFLGFKIKAIPKRDSRVAHSHMSDKAIARSKDKLKEKIKQIAHSGDNVEERMMVNQYNYLVRGLHEYFEIATCVHLDCQKINRSIRFTMKNRLGERLTKHGEYGKGYDDIRKRYGQSEQIRFVHNRPVAPIAYIRTRAPMWKKRTVNKYTPEGRTEIHTPLGLNRTILESIRCEQGYGASIEYMDNRVSRYCGQQGKCAITQEPLEYGAMHCHHVVPKQYGGADAYQNLIWIHVKLHRLLHATHDETIRGYLNELSLTDKQMNKLNRFRKQAQLPLITA